MSDRPTALPQAEAPEAGAEPAEAREATASDAAVESLEPAYAPPVETGEDNTADVTNELEPAHAAGPDAATETKPAADRAEPAEPAGVDNPPLEQPVAQPYEAPAQPDAAAALEPSAADQAALEPSDSADPTQTVSDLSAQPQPHADGDSTADETVAADETDGPAPARTDQPEDPGFQSGALGAGFRPGVEDPAASFTSMERAIADRLSREGWRVDARQADHTVQNKQNPDAMVRKSATDEGSVTEFKTMTSASPNALKREIDDASDQIRPHNGEVVIDGRGVNTTAADALRAFQRALGQPGKTVAATVHVILGD